MRFCGLYLMRLNGSALCSTVGNSFITAGEKVIQGFLLAYLCAFDYFFARSEQELNKGFCDLYLEPL